MSRLIVATLLFLSIFDKLLMENLVFATNFTIERLITQPLYFLTCRHVSSWKAASSPLTANNLLHDIEARLANALAFVAHNYLLPNSRIAAILHSTMANTPRSIVILTGDSIMSAAPC